MVDPLPTLLVVASLVLAVVAVVYLVIDRSPDRTLLLGLAALELALLVQLVIGIVQLTTGQGQVSTVTFLGYLIGIVVVLPLTTLWALGEPGRAGTGVLLVGLLVVPVLVARLQQIWSASG